MSLKDVFSMVCEKCGWQRKGGAIEVTLDGGRSQLVFLEPFDHESEEMVRIYSKVGAADSLTPERLQAILGINFRLAHGALALHDDHLVVCDTFLVREADDDEVQNSILYIAEQADRYERMVYGQDVH